jgi:hypothetical protein
VMWWIERIIEMLFGTAMVATALGYLYFIIGEQRVQRALRWLRALQ